MHGTFGSVVGSLFPIWFLVTGALKSDILGLNIGISLSNKAKSLEKCALDVCQTKFLLVCKDRVH